MARVLTSENFHGIDFSWRVFTHQRYDIYRVYNNATDFVEVQADNAAEAIARGGITRPWKVVHHLPPLRTIALEQDDTRPLGDHEPDALTLPPERVAKIRRSEVSQDFVALPYDTFGREQQQIRILGQVSALEDTNQIPVAHTEDTPLTREEVGALLDSSAPPLHEAE